MQWRTKKPNNRNPFVKPGAILVILFLVSLSAGPVMAYPLHNEGMGSLPQVSCQSGDLATGSPVSHVIHPMMKLKWFHWVVIVVGTMIIGWYTGCSPLFAGGILAP